MDFKALIGPVGIVRILEVIFTCISFSLVASVGNTTVSFWIWCMFSWCFCFCVTFLILILEVTSFSAKLPISWRDFTTAFAMLACLMVGVFLFFSTLLLFVFAYKYSHDKPVNRLLGDYIILQVLVVILTVFRKIKVCIMRTKHLRGTKINKYTFKLTFVLWSMVFLRHHLTQYHFSSNPGCNTDTPSSQIKVTTKLIM